MFTPHILCIIHVDDMVNLHKRFPCLGDDSTSFGWVLRREIGNTYNLSGIFPSPKLSIMLMKKTFYIAETILHCLGLTNIYAVERATQYYACHTQLSYCLRHYSHASREFILSQIMVTDV